MSRLIAAALSIVVGLAGAPALAQGTSPAPDAEPRNHLSPTDESEATPRVPPVTHPKPMERTRIGEPVEAAPNRAAPPERTVPPERAAQTRTAPPRKATAQRVAPQRKVTVTRRAAPTPRDDDTSLSTIFTPPRNDTRTPPSMLAPQAGPSRAMMYNYAPVSPPDFDGAPCPTRSRTSLGALFACTR